MLFYKLYLIRQGTEGTKGHRRIVNRALTSLDGGLGHMKLRLPSL